MPAEAWGIVRRLVSAGLLEDWTLCGGTGLALQLGHRISEDLVLFRADPFELGDGEEVPDRPGPPQARISWSLRGNPLKPEP